MGGSPRASHFAIETPAITEWFLGAQIFRSLALLGSHGDPMGSNLGIPPVWSLMDPRYIFKASQCYTIRSTAKLCARPRWVFGYLSSECGVKILNCGALAIEDIDIDFLPFIAYYQCMAVVSRLL